MLVYFFGTANGIEAFFPPRPFRPSYQETQMLNRIANVVTFLTFCLLSAILWVGTVAMHDFNNPNLGTGNSHIFVREYERHADYSLGNIEGRLIGYQIDYTVCGYDSGYFEELSYGNGVGSILKASEPKYGYMTVLDHFPGRVYTPIAGEEVRRLMLNVRKNGNRDAFEWGTATRRVCQVDLTGVWPATRSFLRSLV